QLCRTARKEPAHLKLQSVTMNDFQTASDEMSAQKIHQPPILLDRQNLRTGVEHRLRDRAETGSDFQYKICGRQPGLLHDPARQVLIVKKILTERLHGRDSNLAQGPTDLGELHRRRKFGADSQKKEGGLFTKLCEQFAPMPR